MAVYNDGIRDFEVNDEIRDSGVVDFWSNGEEAAKEEVSLDIERSSLFLMSLLRKYLRCTGCLVAERRLFILANVLILSSLLVVYLYDVGMLGHYRTLVDEELHEILNAVKNACWSLRFVLLSAVGWIYFSRPHLKTNLARLTMTRAYWKKAQKWIGLFLVAFVLFVFVVPLTCRTIQMRLPTKKQGEAFPWNSVLVNLATSLWSRFFGLPIFVTFVFVLYLTYTKLREFKRRLQFWPKKRQHEVRDEFQDIMKLVKANEKAFQKFLVCQVGLMLVVLIPAALSFAERINNEAHYTVQYMKPSGMSNAVEMPGKDSPVDVLVQGNLSEILATSAAPSIKLTQQLGAPYTEKHVDKKMIVKVAASALALCFEMLMLCSLPLFLLAKISKVMSQLAEAVQMVKFREQVAGGYMVQNQADLEEVLKSLQGARGFRILGMDLTTVKVALITLVTPFITTVIHLMMQHVDIIN